MKYRIRWVFSHAATACLAVLLQSCGVIGAGHTQTAQIAPHYEETQCDFELDYPRRAVCGVLTVSESRSPGSDRTVRIPVVTFPSKDAERRPDPVVYVSGGWATANIHSPMRLMTTWPDFLENANWLAGRDLIIYDPRGAGLARPSLDCPEEKTRAEDHPTIDYPFSIDLDCVAGLRNSGIDVDAYDTRALAADLNDLRRAMGIRSWNIWAESHGTRVTLEAIRQDENGIRSAILAGVYPPGVDDPLVIARNFDRILTERIASCRRHELCHQVAPDLPAMFRALLEDLRDEPRELKVLSRHSLQMKSYEIDDGAFLHLLFRASYSQYGVWSLPFFIIIANDGRLDFAPIQLSDLVGPSPYRSMGASALISCRDGASADPERLRQATARFPYLAGWIEFWWTHADCRQLTGQSEPTLDPRPVKSDLPMLLLSGAYDPVTPPLWAREAARRLPNSRLFVFPGQSHAVGRSACARHIMKRFLSNPKGDPSDPCFELDSGFGPDP